MTQYKQYEIRREVLALKGDEYTRSLLILLEHLDWSSGEKEILNNEHMNNWLLSLSSKYNVDASCMHKALVEGINRGWFRRKVVGNQRFLSLGLKPVPTLIDEDFEEEAEQPGPVETEYVSPYRKPLTRENIRAATACPRCGAEKNLMCFGEKQKKNNREANHKERSQAAARVLKSNTGI